METPRTWGLFPLADQHAGGRTMLLEMMLVGVIAFVGVGLAWFPEVERRRLRLDAAELARRPVQPVTAAAGEQDPAAPGRLPA